MAIDLIDHLEVSVVWFTEGKGSEDIGVHLFENLGQEELSDMVLDSPHRVETELPQAPLSYEGQLFKIRWCVRLRLFLTDGREITAEQPFYLGHLTVEV